ncbi:MAG: hypothetical protein DRP95_06300 [Candidatus Latescibacterota bacterium]|nr:MAG: hypothetical protein DRP95_06300 [Candidatus Latescibacterota bacterium]
MRHWIPFILISLGAVGLTALLSLLGVFDRLELASYDFRFRWRGEEPPDTNIVIVAVDDQSQQELGLNWPFPRSLHAKLVRNLKAAGAKVIVFDVEFFTETLEDAEFAQAIREAGNVILARKMAYRMNQWALPAPLLRESACALAHVDMPYDTDGSIRRAYVVGPEGTSFLAVEAVRRFLDLPPASLSPDRSFASIGPIRVPVDRNGTMLINFSGPSGIGRFPGYSYSYSQVLDDETPWGIKLLMEKGVLRDKIVLVGVTYEEAHDVYQTPFYLGTRLLSARRKTLMPGVEIHANIARTLLSGKFIVRVDRLVLVLLLLAFSAGMAALLSRIEPLWGLSVLLGTSALYAWVVLELFVRLRFWVDLVAPVAGLSFTYVGVVVYRFLMEQREKRMIRGAFAHYVPKSVVDELLKNPQLLSLGGEERELSVLFSDVQGFTSLSERMSPSEIRALLDEYLTPMTEVILGHEGIIDKYEGDAIMAEFGAPLHLPDHARKACLAALDMQAKLAELRERWSQEGKPLLYMRVGVSTGRMVLGNMGSREIFDYTVIGDSVNTASRLEGANKEYGTRILISEATYLAARDHIVVRELDRIRVKGKREPVRAYELLGRREDGLPEDLLEMLEHFHRGLKLYQERRWEEAIPCFQEALRINPEDGPSLTFLRRCRAFLLNPPPEDWDGVFELETK